MFMLLDGGTGHELKSRLAGVADSAVANLTHADVVTQLHRDYVAAGATVLATNTFSVTPGHLARVCRSEHSAAELDALARAAGACASAAAAERGVRVAACLPPLAECYGETRPGDKSGSREDEAFAIYSRLVSALLPVSQLALVETVAQREDAAPAVRAARCAGLPVWLSFTLRDGAGVPTLRGGELLSEALGRAGGDVAAVLVNCSDFASVERALPLLRANACATHYGAKPNAFRQTTSEWLMAGEVGCGAAPPGVYSPVEFAAWGVRAVREAQADSTGRAGRDIALGGCCGTTPAHMAALSAALLQTRQQLS
jgi:homocysteine S-methyltransferase